MKTVKLSMMINVPDEKAVDELKRLTHHIEYLIDPDEWPEIKGIYDVNVTEMPDDKNGNHCPGSSAKLY